MEDLYKILIGMESPEALDLSARIEKFVRGSFVGIFDKQTNIDITNPFTVFSVKDLQDSLRPIAMFVDESDDESIAASIDAGVSAYVVDGLAANRIRPLLDLAVRRFNAFARLQSDLAEVKGKLAERETIDKAKRILMDSKGISEPEAYGELRRKAMSSNKRIAEIAEAVVTAHELLGGT